jgi:hypothetical protein
MARCAADDCNRWRPEVLARSIAGVTVDDQWFCSQGCVERMATQLLLSARRWRGGIPVVPPPRLGALLRHRGLVHLSQLESALAAQRSTRLRLGTQLVAMGVVRSEDVLRALAEQAGVRYLTAVDPARVLDAPGGLPPDAVRALGLVPFGDVDKELRMKVACLAPVPRAALGALGRLVGCTPEPYLVADESWSALLAAYGSRSRGVTRALVTATSVPDAAARIAAAAIGGRHTKVIEAYWDPYTWVRVQSSGVVHDVILSHATPQEAVCLEAPTSH